MSGQDPAATVRAAPSPRRRTRTLGMIAGCLVLTLALAFVTLPRPNRLPDAINGDVALGQIAREALGPYRPAMAVACVTADRSRTATIGAPLEDRFEIGSISKGLTGLLFADMIKRGKVRPDTALGTLLPVTGPLARITLAQLATHSSGLPTQPLTPATAGRNLWASLSATNPYPGSISELIATTSATPLTSPAGTYSNLGFELLGAALAAAADQPYPELLTARILRPLGMSDTLAPTSPDQLAARDLIGETTSGRRTDPWLGPAITPAGGVRSDIADLAVLARALLTKTAPGTSALTPKTTFGQSRIGWAWITTTSPSTGQTITWHNGETGGFTAFLGLDRQSGTAVVLLSSVGEPVDHITDTGFDLVTELKGCRS